VRLTPTTLQARIRSLRARLGGPAVVKRVTAMRGEMDAKTRRVMEADLADLRDAVTEILWALRR
jgi:hypothetical protein